MRVPPIDESQPLPEPVSGHTIVRSYVGKPDWAAELFEHDANSLAKQGYFPISQTYEPGQYGCGAFLLALLLCFILIGILVFLYMLIVKPDGTLTVTYQYRGVEQEPTQVNATKTCPMCAEEVRQAAKICRFCQHEFDQSEKTPDTTGQ